MGPNKSELSSKRKNQTILGVLLGLLLATLLPGAESTPEAAPRTVLFFGDSLTAGYGVDPDEAYPALIQKKLAAEGLNWRVVNAGLSGETTAGGLRRLDWVLRQKIDLFVLELGGNDGLRGISPETSRSNLQAMIDRIRSKQPRVTIVLAGMQLPPNFGAEHTRQFAAMYPDLAAANQVALIPFLLDGVGGIASLNQPDGIHPTAEGHRIVAETVWRVLRPLFR